MQSIEKTYSEKRSSAKIINIPKENMSNAEMWAKLLSNRIEKMEEFRGKKFMLYIEALALCCELGSWDPPDPTNILELLT